MSSGRASAPPGREHDVLPAVWSAGEAKTVLPSKSRMLKVPCMVSGAVYRLLLQKIEHG